MTLQATGAISLSQVNTELGLTASTTVSLGASNVRTLAGVASGLIALSNLYGKSNIPPVTGKGYISGGMTAQNTYNYLFDKFDFVTETIIATSIQFIRRNSSGLNSDTKGYFGGGYTSTDGSRGIHVNGIVFSNDTNFVPSASIVVGRTDLASVNSTIKGYWGGGYDGNFYAEIDGITFSTESSLNPTASLAVGRTSLGGVSSSIKGYFAGGHTANAASNVTEIDGIVFATEIAFNPSAGLQTAGAGNGLNSSTKGYFNKLEILNGLSFSTETSYTLGAVLPVVLGLNTGINSSIKGYWVGGTPIVYDGSKEIQGIAFDTEVVINPSAELSYPRNSLSSMQSGSL